jgi:rod shape-determining protein MreC
VLLINDPSSGAGVILESTRIRGILRGTADGDVQINNLTADSRIKKGETVVTSGGDLVFPRGLPVGTIDRIRPDPQHQPYTAITITPAADLNKLEEVLVVTGTQSTLPPAAQQDAASAEAAAAALAEENRRAADLVAERLPGLHDAGPDGKDAAPGAAKDAAPAPTDIGGVPGIPNSGLPRLHAAAHPDRYSPGATPPAEALKPGERSTPAPEEPKPDEPPKGATHE